jgi:hypothetical protein
MRRCLIPQESSDRQLLTNSSCSTRTPRSAIRTTPTVTQRAKSAVRSAHTRGSIYQEAVHRTAPACVTRASQALPRSCTACCRCKFVAQGCGAAPNSAPTVSAVSTSLYLRSPCDERLCSSGQGFLTVEDPSHDRNRLVIAGQCLGHTRRPRAWDGRAKGALASLLKRRSLASKSSGSRFLVEIL